MIVLIYSILLDQSIKYNIFLLQIKVKAGRFFNLPA